MPECCQHCGQVLRFWENPTVLKLQKARKEIQRLRDALQGIAESTEIVYEEEEWKSIAISSANTAQEALDEVSADFLDEPKHAPENGECTTDYDRDRANHF